MAVFATPTRPSKRQVDKLKGKLVKDLHFLIQWLHEDELYDVLPYKDMVMLPKDCEIYSIPQGTVCKAKYEEELFEVAVVSSGKYADMKREQKTLGNVITAPKLSNCTTASSPKKMKLNSPKKSPKKGKSVAKSRPPKKVITSAKKKIKSITDDRARGNENGRVSSDILNQVLTEDDISDKADEQVHTQSSPACSVHLSTILSEVSGDMDGSLDDGHQHPPAALSNFSYTPYTPYSGPYQHSAASGSYQSSPRSQSPWQSPYYDYSSPNVSSELQEIRALLKDGLSGMCTRINSLQSDIDKVNKKLVKHSKRGKEKEEFPGLRRSDSGSSEHNLQVGLFASPSGSSTSPSGISNDQGCILGDPNGPPSKNTNLSSPSQHRITSIEAVSKGASKLALKLLSILFTKEEIAAGICVRSTGGEGSLLDQTKIQGIKLHVDYIYPLATSDAEKERWHKIVHGNLNSKCRNTKNNTKPCNK